MRRVLVSVASFLLVNPLLHAQSIAGTWQGTLPMYGAAQGASVYGNPRIVFTIEKSADGSFHGGITFVDRGATVPLTSVTFSAPDVTDQWGTANAMDEFVAAKSFNDVDKGLFVAPPV